MSIAMDQTPNTLLTSAYISRIECGDTNAQEKLGLTATSLRIMNHSTLDMPISGPSIFLAKLDMHPTATRMNAPMVHMGSRRATGGSSGTNTP
jgi:hypothetical protein